MQRLNLITLGLILTLVSCSNGQKWGITVERHITEQRGANLTILCHFTYPTAQHTKDVKVYWKTQGKSECSKNDNDRSAFVFHPQDSCVVPKYRGKTKLIGDKLKGNCSLLITDIREGEPGIYVRISGLNDSYSFKQNPVSISLNGVAPVTFGPAFTDSNIFPTTPSQSVTTMPTSDDHLVYLVIIPVLALLILIVAGIVVYRKHKSNNTLGVISPSRSGSSTHRDSGYYVNFSRTSSKPPESNVKSCKTLDMKGNEQKAIDEPVYINFQKETNQISQSMDPIENIYANVDYTK
ncbi:uncharacterized protein PAE49_005334 [Odontesthes bonariensis]|uniref:uncharacterized protein LOC142379894 n=1 Tax=Odontesthes bonariensis TaxID=219752 RepID=UPI003F585DF1